MRTSNKENVQLLIKHCLDHGVKHVVFSPGSRNAPLIIAFNQVPDIECVVVPDERSAAFFALGLAQQSKGLVAIACTSGSAPLNYYPAISEAYYQNIPLLVLTADRPVELVDQGDGQTIVQTDVFRNHINYAISIPEDATSSYINRELSSAFYHATQGAKGPVHINMPFTEPLYDTVELDYEQKAIKHIVSAELKRSFDSAQRYDLEKTWKEASKIMILIGQMSPNPVLYSYLSELADNPAVSILVENTSNLVHPFFIHCIDRTYNAIEELEKEQFAPDLLITLGGAIVSKKIKNYLRSHKPANHWKVGYAFPMMDTYKALTMSFEMSEVDFFRDLVTFKQHEDASYRNIWKQKDYLVQEKCNSYYLENPGMSDLTVFKTLMDVVPEDSYLHLANSSVIRYAQLFDPIKTVSYWCNRGTSGIDGSSSTAVGAAYAAQDKWHTLITGDVSFFYDSNAFWHHNLKPNFRVFLINNAGGGIFKIIPGPGTSEELEKFFVFENTYSAEYICKAFGLGYHRATSLDEIDMQLEEFFAYEEDGRPKLMEIFTDKDENPKVLADYFAKIKLA